MWIIWDIMRYYEIHDCLSWSHHRIISYPWKKIFERRSWGTTQMVQPGACGVRGVVISSDQVLDVAAVKIPGQREPCCCNSTGDCRALWGTSLYVEPKSKHVAQGCRQRRRYRGTVWIFELCMPMAYGSRPMPCLSTVASCGQRLMTHAYRPIYWKD